MEDSRKTPLFVVLGLLLLQRGREWLTALSRWTFQEERVPWKLDETWRSPLPPLTVRARLEVGGTGGTSRVATFRSPPVRFTVTEMHGQASRITLTSVEVIFIS